MALLGMFNVHRHGAINSAAIVLYALTSCVSGYISCSFYTQINGQRWVWNIILTSSLFSGESNVINIIIKRTSAYQQSNLEFGAEVKVLKIHSSIIYLQHLNCAGVFCPSGISIYFTLKLW